MPHLACSIEGDVAHLVLDNPPHNRLAPQFIDDLEEALTMAGASSGTAVADEAMLDIAMPLFDSEDVKSALPAAAGALKTGKPRPTFAFTGR